MLLAFLLLLEFLLLLAELVLLVPLLLAANIPSPVAVRNDPLVSVLPHDACEATLLFLIFLLPVASPDSLLLLVFLLLLAFLLFLMPC
jgi:hypothetical protein